MKATFRIFFCILFLSSTFISLSAQNVTYEVIRRAPAEKINRYLKDKNFIYEREKVYSTNIWGRIMRWIEHALFRQLFKNHNITVWDIILYAIAATAIFLIIYYLIKSERTGLFRRSSNDGTVDIDLENEDIHSVNFDALISEAVAKGQYRTAIRYLYLRSLKDLSVKGLILWKVDKTNRDYSNELRTSAVGKGFNEVTYLFDYAWYGNIDINENSFNRIKYVFEQFNNQIRSSA